MVHQHFTLAENLTGLDNIMLGTEPVFRLNRRTGAARRKVEAVMRESGLTVDLDVQVSRLTVGERQRVEILKALYRDARILVLDEPTAVLTPPEADGLFATIRSLAAGGLAVIFISHKLGEVLAVSHRIAVLRGGRKVGEMPTASADRRKIAELMVGRDVPVSRRTPRAPGAALLELDRVSVGGGHRRAAGGRVARHCRGRDRRHRRRLRQRPGGARRARRRPRRAGGRDDAPLRRAGRAPRPAELRPHGHRPHPRGPPP